jgi:hypothetical protein
MAIQSNGVSREFIVARRYLAGGLSPIIRLHKICRNIGLNSLLMMDEIESGKFRLAYVNTMPYGIIETNK